VLKDSRNICGGRLEAMNSELWVPGKPSFTKPYCSKWGSATMDPTSMAACGTAMEKHNKQQNAIEQQLFLKTRNGNIRSTGKHSTLKAEEGYCNEATQSRPLTHSQSHQAQHTAEHKEVKHGQAWTKRRYEE
jgi:hypothetical protein